MWDPSPRPQKYKTASCALVINPSLCHGTSAISLDFCATAIAIDFCGHSGTLFIPYPLEKKVLVGYVNGILYLYGLWIMAYYDSSGITVGTLSDYVLNWTYRP